MKKLPDKKSNRIFPYLNLIRMTEVAYFDNVVLGEAAAYVRRAGQYVVIPLRHEQGILPLTQNILLLFLL